MCVLEAKTASDPSLVTRSCTERHLHLPYAADKPSRVSRLNVFHCACGPYNMMQSDSESFAV